ncbi:MAG TPA: hypothetical protein VHD62_06275 [Opitutaceae bacterium]|nr:hypothetical protein [Opitutaceae bacterium]
MENAENASIAAEELLKKYKGELNRLEGTKKGLETKIASTKAKIEAAEEIVKATAAMAAKKMI